VRYADGVLAMINVLRLLTLGGPRTWDANMYKQVRCAEASCSRSGSAALQQNRRTCDR
jgi:hypothetical protein